MWRQTGINALQDGIRKYFTFVESTEPQLEDDMWTLNDNDKVYIQDASLYGGGYFVNAEVKDGFLEIGGFQTLRAAMVACIDWNRDNSEMTA